MYKEGLTPSVKKGMDCMDTVSIAHKAGIPLPTYEAMLQLASVVNETDFYAIGRTLENLKLADLSLEELKDYFLSGKRP